MKIVGLTGGIGSGKTTVAKMFVEHGIPVYIADIEAKKLMNSSKDLQTEIIGLLGEEAYIKGQLNREYIATKVFKNTDLLEGLNGIVHPAVAKHFLEWKNNHNSPYVIKEAAILFENGGYKQCDYTILVTAPEEVRIDRVIKRDGSTRKQVLDRMKNQWKDSEKKKLADFIVVNDDLKKTWLKINEIHNKIVK